MNRNKYFLGLVESLNVDMTKIVFLKQTKKTKNVCETCNAEHVMHGTFDHP